MSLSSFPFTSKNEISNGILSPAPKLLSHDMVAVAPESNFISNEFFDIVLCGNNLNEIVLSLWCDMPNSLLILCNSVPETRK